MKKQTLRLSDKSIDQIKSFDLGSNEKVGLNYTVSFYIDIYFSLEIVLSHLEIKGKILI